MVANLRQTKVHSSNGVSVGAIDGRQWLYDDDDGTIPPFSLPKIFPGCRADIVDEAREGR